MTIRPIIRFPDPRLQQKAETVTQFDDALKTLCEDLLQTMRAAPGIGITAPHIGILMRVVVLEISLETKHKFYINPEIIEASTETIRHQEGSVSMPDMVDEIERHAKIRLRYQDLEGNVHFESSEGLLSVCHQHEIDQLNGLFWLQRLSRLKRDRLIKRYSKLNR
ncbi:peptide deformylase [Brucellaceae bacterium C25G]